MKAYMAELVGTAILVIGGCGTAIFAAGLGYGLAVPLAFGFTIAVIIYMIGHISGAHVNPAVTVALALSNKFAWNKVPAYIVSQLAGGVLGGGVLYLIAHGIKQVDIARNGFAQNTFNVASVSPLSALVLEIVLTAIFVLVVLATTRTTFTETHKAVAVGLALSLVHMIGLGITGVSVNPARSLGVGVFVPDSFSQFWVFVIGPMAGAVLAYIIHTFVFGRDYHHHEHVEVKDTPSTGEIA